MSIGVKFDGSRNDLLKYIRTPRKNKSDFRLSGTLRSMVYIAVVTRKLRGR